MGARESRSLQQEGDFSIGPVGDPSRKVGWVRARGEVWGSGATGTGLGLLACILTSGGCDIGGRAERLPAMLGLKAAGCRAGEMSGPYRA